MQTDHEEDNIESDEDQYEEAISKLAVEWKKGRKTRSQAIVKQLMDNTNTLHRKWIEEECPLVYII